VAFAALACAQPGTPPGGEPDNSPPRVIAVEPEPFDTVRDPNRSVEIRFDERISERLEGIAEFRDAVIVSPATSPVRSDQHRRSVEITLAGGWEPNRVYTVEVRPLFRDLFGNRRVEPIHLVFSTGAAIPETALAGFVEDRLTGEPVEGARIEARPVGDSIPYVTVTDSSGFFALRHVPPVDFDVSGWMDQDRDREADFLEAQDAATASLAAGDTVVVEMAILPMDTTAARLARAEAIDSTRVRLTFDDYFAVGPVSGEARLLRAADSSFVAQGALLHGARLDSLLAAERAVRDSLAAARADSVALDTVARLPTDTAGAQPDRLGGDLEGGPPARPEAGAPRRDREVTGPPLPSRELILLLPRPLIPDSAYLVRVDAVINIRGVPGGGGAAGFVAPPPPADTATGDTAPDTTADPAGLPGARPGPSVRP
jgi:hypothetical protein